MKRITIIFLTTLWFASVQAQKLPNKQEISFRAPANVKIDGKATEWGDFKAYNSAIELLMMITTFTWLYRPQTLWWHVR